jgi:hypothetical protein
MSDLIAALVTVLANGGSPTLLTMYNVASLKVYRDRNSSCGFLTVVRPLSYVYNVFSVVQVCRS